MRAQITPRTRRTGSPSAWGVRLHLVVWVPLLILHAALLGERVAHPESIDGLVAIRWLLSAGFISLLMRTQAAIRSTASPFAAIAAVLVFALIHLPLAAPEPGTPLAVTTIGLALSLWVINETHGGLTIAQGARTGAPCGDRFQDSTSTWPSFRDRAPPLGV